MIDAAELNALIAAVQAAPERLAALERQTAQLAVEMKAIRAALPPALVTIPEAAAAFKVAVPTIRRWVKAGIVPVVKVGNTVRIDLARFRGVDDLEVARLARLARTTSHL